MTTSALQKLLPGFRQKRLKTSGAEINALVKGEGPPLLLLHGHPQTLACWHKIAPKLAERFTVVLTDLRGYGDSSKPDGGKDSIAYSKREMARDQVEVMRALGFDRFQAVGHDRGGRVLHRLMLDHPDTVSSAVLLDIAPTATMYAKVNKEFATRYMWWFFLIQPAPLPETLIGNNLEFYLQTHINKQNKTPGAIDPVALEEYRRCYTRETLHAVCEDYRAAAGIDLIHDEADSDKRIGCPLLVLWGGKGVVGSSYDVLDTWRAKAKDVRGGSLPCGHYLPEEAPELLLEQLNAFLA
ncbi:alpha/beta hydrolase [Bradyrhizobium sp. C-145]|uniref:alpha/beta fold hydrolase n=1 Tax=Bradyrhizobium sp. C-145 TaxID=574727 RepID=UPI00201B52A0|nr:alpha/beta hydrolase [Bradyrhizobium sp. C-145]UQR67040.1 alpha/beta hydrolase [Bradyrhizobium sp. C-145]